MTDILVGSNVILDVLTEDPQWFEWSAQMLTNYADQGDLVINPIIYAEISIGFNQPEELEAVLPEEFFFITHTAFERFDISCPWIDDIGSIL